MIKCLRIKFICINMTIVTIMLCVIFGLVLHFTSAGLERDSIEMMRSVALKPPRTGVPGEKELVLPQAYFVLDMEPSGTWTASGSGYYDLTDQERLNELARLSSDRKTGVLREYGLRFMHVTTPMNQRVIFADISGEIHTMNHLFQNCLLIGGGSFVIFLIVSILLANWAVKPVAVAWERQRQFVADASHELKTPLTVILSNTQTLADNGDDPQLREKLTASILTVSQQMKDLVMKLLDSARVDHGLDPARFAPVDLSRAISNAALPFDAIFFERELELESEIQEGIWVHGSQSHLIQVVDILLDNACKYSTEGGRTRVTLRRQGKRACLLAVENEGDALTSKELKNIFKRFYRSDAARERNGSYGLGLSIAESIVTAHRGKIWAESENGVNTFFAQLPVTAEKG